MNNRLQLALSVMLGVVLSAAGCAGKPPAVFDKPAMDAIHTLLVVPLQSPQDPSAGPIVSGMLSIRLQNGKLCEFCVIEPPSLWRLGDAPTPMTDAQAMRIARDMSADAVLTGTVTYAISLATPKGMPGVARKGMKGITFQEDFAARNGAATVNLRILSTKANRPAYVHTGTAGGLGGRELLIEAFDGAIGPFEKYIRSSRK